MILILTLQILKVLDYSLSSNYYTFMWILLTLSAVISQLFRNAFSKKFSSLISPLAVTFCRFFFGLPAVLFAYWILSLIYQPVRITSPRFFILAALMGVFQIIGTFLLINLFKFKNFAVSLTLIKFETIILAVLGIIFLGEIPTAYAWVGIIFAFMGLILASFSKNKINFPIIRETLFSKASLLAILSGTSFAICTLFLKRAMVYVQGDSIAIISIFSLLVILILETLIVFPFLLLGNREDLLIIFKKYKTSFAIGFSSSMGSFLWFTAIGMTYAAYVKTLGQTEFIFGILFSLKVFKEKISLLEVAGMILVATGSLIIVFT